MVLRDFLLTLQVHNLRADPGDCFSLTVEAGIREADRADFALN
jgi:hypothetical protein